MRKLQTSTPISIIGHQTHPHTTLPTTNASKVYFNPQHDRVPTFILVSRHHPILYNERLYQKKLLCIDNGPDKVTMSKF